MCRRQPDEAESPQYESHCAGTLAGGRWASKLLFAGTAVQDASSATVRQSWLKLLPERLHMLQHGGCPKIKGTGYRFGVPRLGIVVFWDPYGGPLLSGNYRIVLDRRPESAPLELPSCTW